MQPAAGFHPAVENFVRDRARGESRARLDVADPKDPVVAKWFGRMNLSDSGVYVDEDTALSVSTVYGCIKVISETIGIIPFRLFRDKVDAVEPASDYYLYRLLMRRPNKWQTPFEFKRMLTAHVALRGNGYARLVTDPSTGRLDQLLPLHPDRVTPFMAPDGSRAYSFQPLSGPRQTFLQDEIFHLIGHTDDGIKGLSVITHAKDAIGLAYATQRYGSRFFRNDARPGGALSHPGKLSDEAYQRLKKDWEERHQGAHNAHRLAILEEGLKFEEIGMSAQDAQFVESRKISPIEICQYFRMPPHKVALLDRATFSNIEQQSIEFVGDTMMPWVVLWNESGNRDLLTIQQERDTMFFKGDVDELQRGDMSSRFTAYNTGIQGGFLSRNEVRRRENMNPFAGGDEYLRPLNMEVIGKKPQGSQT